MRFLSTAPGEGVAPLDSLVGFSGSTLTNFPGRKLLLSPDLGAKWASSLSR